MSVHSRSLVASSLLASLTMVSAQSMAQAQVEKPNIVLIVSDDFGYGDMGVYGGGENRGQPTPNLDRIANEGMQFWSFYGQPSCTPGRAAMMTGRIPNRSGMTTVSFQGQGGGLPAAEWTLASVLKTGGYDTFFTGKWHLGEADYALPNAQGFDVMKYCGLYHLNAYTYGDPTWFPDMSPELRDMFNKVTKGAMSGNAGETAHEDFKINGQYVDTPDKGVVGIPFFDQYVEKASLDYLDSHAHSAKPFFMSVNFMKVHQPNMPAPEFQLKSMAKTKFATRWSRTTRASAGSWRRFAWASTRTPMCSGRPTTAPGRTSIPTPAHAVPRHQGHGARRRRAGSGARLGSGHQAGSKSSDIVGGLDIWRPSLRSPASSCRRTTGENRSSSTVTTCRRSCSARANRSDRLVLLHRG